MGGMGGMGVWQTRSVKTQMWVRCWVRCGVRREDGEDGGQDTWVGKIGKSVQRIERNKHSTEEGTRRHNVDRR